MRDLLFLSVILTILPFVFRFPMVGVMGWAWTALLSPNDWLFSFMASVPFNKLFAGATLVSMVLNARQLRLRMNTVLWLMLAMAIIGSLSAVFSIDQTDFGWQIYIKFMKILLFGFVIAACVRTRLHIHAVLLAVALGMGFVGVSEGTFYIVSGGGHKITGNPSIGDNNQLAVALLMVLPIIIYLASQAEVRWVKAIGYIASGLVLAALVGTASRGALVGLMALGAFRVVRGKRKLAGLLAIVVVGVVILATAPESWFQRMDTIGDANQDTSFMGRVIAWKISTAIALDRPLIGGGFHAVQTMFTWGYYGSKISMFDFVPTAAPDEWPHAAHSIYFETLGDLGFLALVIFLALLFNLYRNGQKLRVLTKGRDDLVWAYDLAFALQSSLVGFMVAGAAVSVAYTDLFYVLLVLSASSYEVVLAQMQGAGQLVRRGGVMVPVPQGKGTISVGT